VLRTEAKRETVASSEAAELEPARRLARVKEPPTLSAKEPLADAASAETLLLMKLVAVAVAWSPMATVAAATELQPAAK
jgi:hypothetical protein